MIRTNIRTNIIGLLGIGVVMAAAAIAPTAANADGLQNDKNNARNIAILGGIAAVYGVTHHNGGLAVVGAGTAIVAANQFNRDQRVENWQSGYCGPTYYAPAPVVVYHYGNDHRGWDHHYEHHGR